MLLFIDITFLVSINAIFFIIMYYIDVYLCISIIICMWWYLEAEIDSSFKRLDKISHKKCCAWQHRRCIAFDCFWWNYQQIRQYIRPKTVHYNQHSVSLDMVVWVTYISIQNTQGHANVHCAGNTSITPLRKYVFSKHTTELESWAFSHRWQEKAWCRASL